jgi:hypothetical protein
MNKQQPQRSFLMVFLKRISIAILLFIPILVINICADPVSPLEEDFPFISIVIIIVSLIVECVIEIMLFNKYNIFDVYINPLIFIVNILSYTVASPFLFFGNSGLLLLKTIVAEISIILFESFSAYLLSKNKNVTGPEGATLTFLGSLRIFAIGNLCSLSISILSMVAQYVYQDKGG